MPPPARRASGCGIASYKSLKHARAELLWRQAGLIIAMGVLLPSLAIGCGSGGEVKRLGSSVETQAPLAELHTRFDVLFVGDLLQHDAQILRLCRLILAKEGIERRITQLAERVARENSTRTTELQALMLEWGFTQTIVAPLPLPAPEIRAGDAGHPLAADAEFRALSDAAGRQATESFIASMVRQLESVIRSARDYLGVGANTKALAAASTLMERAEGDLTLLSAPR